MYARVQNYAYNSHNLVEKKRKTFGWLKNQNEELQTQYRYRLLFESLISATLFSQMTYITTGFR